MLRGLAVLQNGKHWTGGERSLEVQVCFLKIPEFLLQLEFVRVYVSQVFDGDSFKGFWCMFVLAMSKLSLPPVICMISTIETTLENSGSEIHENH